MRSALSVHGRQLPTSLPTPKEPPTSNSQDNFQLPTSLGWSRACRLGRWKVSWALGVGSCLGIGSWKLGVDSVDTERRTQQEPARAGSCRTRRAKVDLYLMNS